VRSVREVVGKSVCRVATAVSTKFGSQHNSCNEVEENRYAIKHQAYNWNGKFVGERGEQAEQNGEPGERCDEDCEVDTGWVSGECFCNHITDQGGDDDHE